MLQISGSISITYFVKIKLNTGCNVRLFWKRNRLLREKVDICDFWASTGVELTNKISHQLSIKIQPLSVQFRSVAQLCPTLWDPMNCSTPGLPVHHQLPESIQTDVHWVSDAIQPSHPLSSSSPPALNLSQYQGLFKWVNSEHQVAKVLEFQLQHQSFQWTPRTDLL